MTPTRIALFVGLLLAGLVTGILWRAAGTAPTPDRSPEARAPKTGSARASAAPPRSSEAPGTMPSRPGPALDEETARRLGVHPIRNETCPIMGNPNGGESFSIVYNGLLVRFCCPGCDGDFLEDPARHLAAMKKDGADVPEYALAPGSHPPVVDVGNETCPVTGRPIGDSKLYLVHRSHRIRVCCPRCIAAVLEKPERVEDLLPAPDAERIGEGSRSAAKEALVAAHDIGNTACPVMGNATDADSFAIVYNGLKVRFCCPGCDGKFLEKPREFLATMKREGADVPETALAVKANPEVIELGNETCPVMGDPVGDSEIYLVHQGIKIRLCCEACIADFAAQRDAIMKSLAATDPRVAARIGD